MLKSTSSIAAVATIFTLAAAGSASGTINYSSGVRTVQANDANSSSTTLTPFNQSVTGSGGFFPAPFASLNSDLLPDRITYSGRVSASGGRASGVDIFATAAASQNIIVQFSQSTRVWNEGNWTFVQGIPSTINAFARIRPLGSSTPQFLPGSESPLLLAAGTYQIETSVSSNAGPSAITGTADYNYTIRLSEVPVCLADVDGSGSVDVNDIFEFLNRWFAGDPRADFNGVDGVNTQDIFDLLNAWFAGCP